MQTLTAGAHPVPEQISELRGTYSHSTALSSGVVPFNLSIRYLHGHHSELMNRENAQKVADAINSHLTFTTDEASLFCGADISKGLGQTASSTRINCVRKRPSESLTDC
jgi:hypothetical protein